MNHGSNSRRSRNNRGGRQNKSGNTRVYDSNGPDVRIRGTAHQITEKYENLAKDATSSGDYVMAESYMQYAEHYQRIINGWLEQIDDVMNNNSKGKYETFNEAGELQYPQNTYKIGENKANGDIKANEELADA